MTIKFDEGGKASLRFRILINFNNSEVQVVRWQNNRNNYCRWWLCHWSSSRTECMLRLIKVVWIAIIPGHECVWTEARVIKLVPDYAFVHYVWKCYAHCRMNLRRFNNAQMCLPKTLNFLVNGRSIIEVLTGSICKLIESCKFTNLVDANRLWGIQN